MLYFFKSIILSGKTKLKIYLYLMELMFVSFQNSHIEGLNPNVITLGGRALGKYLGLVEVMTVEIPLVPF